MVRLAMIGTGWQGQGHLNTLKLIEDVETVGICDLNAVMLAKVSGKFGLPGYDNVPRMLEETKPDGIIICTPPEARTELIREAAHRGIACFIEKPPAKDLAMAEESGRILESSGVLNSVGFMFRYSSAVDKARELMAGRRVALVRSTMLDGLALRPEWPRWFFNKARSGGPIFDQAIHMIDLSRFVLGELAQVSGFQGNLTVPQSEDFTVEDSFSLAWRYRSGVMQNHAHSWAYPGFLTQLEFISDELHLTLDLGKGTLLGKVGEQDICFQASDALYRLELEAFVQAIRERRPELIRSTYADSTQSLRATLAAVEAIEYGRVVEVR